ncbi:exocyst complex component EXO70A1-like [Neltuma alba]|uniref:exocyst complex component EXO70A1-like n=1 Tax=Neltuma alba TaxID=207710 RepID=UPI0010A44F1F|nr:exocyst complex component EXO70A1-like [Prosopis alba]
MDNIEATRQYLKSSLEISGAIASALDDSGSRLEILSRKCQSLEASLRPICTQDFSFLDMGDRIDGVLCSAAAVLKVFDAIHPLENSLLADPSSDLCTYVSDTKKFEEALKLLTDNCTLALGWLQEILELLQDKAVVSNEFSLLNVKKSLRILQELQAMEEDAHLDGGLLSAAFDKLEVEFKRLLKANSLPLPLSPLTSSINQQTTIPALPASLTGKLQAIIERLHANGRLDRIKSIYVEVRGMNARRSLQALDLSYLEIPTAKFEDIHSIESHIEQWGKHLKLVANHLLEMEYRFSGKIFEKIGADAWKGCFAKVAIDSKILSFLQFGINVARSKTDPIKLLKLLDIFSILNDLRLKFNQLFSGEACEEIRTVTKDLISRVINGACEIFWQLPAQVKLQRPSSPPSDGSVPRLVSFVTDYCNELLGDTYKPLLTQALEIHLSWRNEAYEESIIFAQVFSIVKEIAVNLDAWSKAYEDITLSYVFMMNNHCHFHNLRDTMLGNMMGDSWLKAHEQYEDYYAALYLKHTWGKLLPILNKKDILSVAVAVSSSDMAKRLNTFNVAFDEMYKRQSNWVISDETLREKVRKHIVEGMVPSYRSFMKNYSLTMENDEKAVKCTKYTEQNLEKMLWSLFEMKITKYGSMKQVHFISKIKQMSAQLFTLATTV